LINKILFVSEVIPNLITGDCVSRGRVEDDWQHQFFNTSYANNNELTLRRS